MHPWNWAFHVRPSHLLACLYVAEGMSPSSMLCSGWWNQYRRTIFHFSSVQPSHWRAILDIELLVWILYLWVCRFLHWWFCSVWWWTFFSSVWLADDLDWVVAVYNYFRIDSHHSSCDHAKQSWFLLKKDTIWSLKVLLIRAPIWILCSRKYG